MKKEKEELELEAASEARDEDEAASTQHTRSSKLLARLDSSRVDLARQHFVGVLCRIPLALRSFFS